MKGPILIIQTAFTGDVILATPLIEAFMAEHPGVPVDVLVRKGNEGLLQQHPGVREVLVWDKSTGKYRSLWKLFWRIRKSKYEVVINCQRFAASGILTAFSGSYQTIGFQKNPLSLFFRYQVEHTIEPGIHECERNLALIHVLGMKGQPKPKLYPPEKAIASGAFITLSPASVWFTKQWPKERWIELLQRIPAQLNVHLLGAPGDKALCDEIIQASGRTQAVNQCGKLTLLESAALIRDAVMNVVNDSAPMHLASAVDAPVAALFCSTIPEFGFGPLSSRSIVLETPEKLACRPCGLHGKKACPEGHFRCGLGISAEAVLKLLPAA